MDPILPPQDEDQPEERSIQEGERKVEPWLWDALIIIAVQQVTRVTMGNL